MAIIAEQTHNAVVGGVDTPNDLDVVAVVDRQNRVLGTRSFATTRQGYWQMLAWMRSFGDLQRVGMESTGSYGSGLLRFLQQANVTVLEVTTPDKHDRTVTPRSRDGMIEALRVLVVSRKTAVTTRRIALQMIHNTVVAAPDGLRDQLR